MIESSIADVNRSSISKVVDSSCQVDEEMQEETLIFQNARFGLDLTSCGLNAPRQPNHTSIESISTTSRTTR